MITRLYLVATSVGFAYEALTSVVVQTGDNDLKQAAETLMAAANDISAPDIVPITVPVSLEKMRSYSGT